jgi:hypothetical protein
MSKDEALKLALEALKRMKRFGNTFGYRSHEQNPYEQVCEAIDVCEKAIAAPVQEPVAVVGEDKHGPFVDWLGDRFSFYERNPVGTKFYTTPPAAQRQWVEVEQVKWDGEKFIAKLKEKNSD